MPRRAFAAVPALVLILAACTPQAAAPSSAAPSDKPTFEATPSASATVIATESPGSAEPTATEEPGSPDGFTVLPNADADTLFLDRDECTNSEDGYRLQFPEEWYTNTEIGDVPACSWFSPTFYEADESGDVPAEIAITIELLGGDRGYLNEFISNEEVIVGATQTAHRVEVESEGMTMYEYVVQLGPTSEEGPNLLARTATDMGGDYELNKAVLDRIMATIEFLGTIQ